MGRVTECEHIRACRMAYEGEGCKPMCDLGLPCNLYEQKVDRDALLGVLDEMDVTVRYAGPDVERDCVEAWAGRIREALGVER